MVPIRGAEKLQGDGNCRRRRTAEGLAVVLLLVGVGAAACGNASRVGIASAPSGSITTTTTLPPPSTSAPIAPSAADRPAFSPGDVVAGRFVRTVILDNGSFVVTPAPAGTQPQISQAAADVVLESDARDGEAFGCSPQGGGSCVIGFGDVSIAPSLTHGVHNAPAWVAARTSPASAALCTLDTSPGPGTTPGSIAYPWEYEVAVAEGSGTQVLNYVGRTSVCGDPPSGPSLTQGVESVSIPWQLVALHGSNITFRYQDFGCDPYAGTPSMALGSDSKTEQGSLGVYIDVPYRVAYLGLFKCGGSWTTTTADFGPESEPPGAPRAPTPIVVTHDPTGPVGESK